MNSENYAWSQIQIKINMMARQQSCGVSMWKKVKDNKRMFIQLGTASGYNMGTHGVMPLLK